MRSRDGIKVSATTSGSVTPGFEGLGKPYRYQGNPEWVPGHADFRDDAPGMAAGSGGDIQTAARNIRQEKFAAALASLGYPDPVTAPNHAVVQAGERVGVTAKTAKSYRTAIKRQRGDS